MKSIKIFHKEVNHKDYTSFMKRWLGTNMDIINDSFPYEKSLDTKANYLINNRSQKTNTTILKTSFQDGMVIYNEEIKEELY